MFHCYWVNCVNQDDFPEHAELIGRILRGEVRIEKMIGADIYKARISRVKRLFWVTETVNGYPQMVVLPVDADFISHDYRRLRYRNPHVLKKQVAKILLSHAQSDSTIDLTILDNDTLLEDYLTTLKLDEFDCGEAAYDTNSYFYDNQFLRLSDKQRDCLSYRPPAILSGAAGSGKSCVLKKVTQELIKNINDSLGMKGEEQLDPILFVAQSKELVNKAALEWGIQTTAAWQPHLQFKTIDELLRDGVQYQLHFTLDLHQVTSLQSGDLIWDGYNLSAMQPSGALLPLSLSPEVTDPFQTFKKSPEDNKAIIPQSQLETLITQKSLLAIGLYLPENKRGMQDFMHWFRAYLKRKHKSIQNLYSTIKPEAIYHEFRTLSAFMSNEELDERYYELGAAQSLFHSSPEQKAHIPKFYRDYKKYLQDNRYWDPAFSHFATHLEFTAILVDEASDLSTLQLRSLYERAKNGHIYYAMDSHQMLQDWTSHRPWLINFLKNVDPMWQSHHLLTESYRSSVAIIRLINELIQIKYRLTGGTADKSEISQLPEPEAPDKPYGNIELLSVTKNEDADLRDRYCSSEYVIITLEQYKAEASERYYTPCVYTIEEVKGLQYTHVIVYKLLDGLTEENKALSQVKEDVVYSNRAKRDNRKPNFAPQINQLCCALMRATCNVYLVQDLHHNIANIYTIIKNHIQNNQMRYSIHSGSAALSVLEKFSQVEEFLKRGQLQEAKDIFLKELQKSEAEFQSILGLYLPQSRLVINKSPKPIAEHTDVVTDLKDTPCLTKARKPVMKFNLDITSAKNMPRIQKQIHQLLSHFTIENLNAWFNEPNGAKLLSLQIKTETRSISFLGAIAHNINHHKIFCEFLLQCERSSKHDDVISKIENETRFHDENTLLHIACYSNYSQLVEILLSKGYSANCYNIHRETPTLLAIRQGNFGLLDALMEAGGELEKLYAPNPIGLTSDSPELILAIDYSLREPAYDPSALVLMPYTNNRYILSLACKSTLVLAAQMGDLPMLQHALNELVLATKQNPLDIINQHWDEYLGATLLTIACQHNHLNIVEFLIQYDADVNKPLFNGATPLLIAVQFNCFDIVKYLLSMETCDINQPTSEGLNPLIAAAYYGYKEIVDYLLKNGACLGFQYQGLDAATIASACNQIHLGPIFDDAMRQQRRLNNLFKNFNLLCPTLISDTSFIAYLNSFVSLGTKSENVLAHIFSQPDLKEIFIRALIMKPINLTEHEIDTLHPDDIKITALKKIIYEYKYRMNNAIHVAAEHNATEFLKLCFTVGIDINAPNDLGVRPIIFAIKHNHLKTVRLLSQCVLNINQSTGNVLPPLAYAVQCNEDISHLGIICYLLKTDAALLLNITNAEQPLHPLAICAFKGNLTILNVLLKQTDINVDVQNSMGISALFIAANKGYFEIVKALINKNARVDLALNDGKTPLQVALENKHLDIAECLIVHGANTSIIDNHGRSLLETYLILRKEQGRWEPEATALISHGMFATTSKERESEQSQCVTDESSVVEISR